MKKKLKLIFFGTGTFAVPLIEVLLHSPYIPSLIVTQPDKPQKRSADPLPNPIKKILQHSSFPRSAIVQPPDIKQNAIFNTLNHSKPDLGIVAAYGQILPKHILDLFPYGCLNIHASLLPLYRGPSPITSAILQGEQDTGITIMLMDEHMDTGPIVCQEKLPITPIDTTPTLEKKLSHLSARILLEIIPQWLEKKITPKPQQHAHATYTQLLTKQDGKLDWTKPASYLERHVRAMYPWPGSWTIWKEKNKKLTIQQASVYTNQKQHSVSNKKNKQPANNLLLTTNPNLGTILVLPENKIGIQTSKDILVVEKLQLEGKNVLDSCEFVRGQPNFIGGHCI